MEIVRFDVWVLQQALPAGAGKIGCSYYVYHVLVPESAQFFQKQKIKRFLQRREFKLFNNSHDVWVGFLNGQFGREVHRG